MSNMPFETAMGYEPPRNVQFSVFLDNRVGKLKELIDIFDGHALTLAALSVMESADHAVVRLITSRCDLARRILQRNHFSFSESDVLVVELNAGHTLSFMGTLLLSAEVSIRYLYPLLSTLRGYPAVVLNTDDQVLAAQLLRRKLFTLLGENDLGDNATPGDASI